jgi:hypothetical protein
MENMIITSNRCLVKVKEIRSAYKKASTTQQVARLYSSGLNCLQLPSNFEIVSAFSKILSANGDGTQDLSF